MHRWNTGDSGQDRQYFATQMTLLVGCGAIASSNTPLPATRPAESMSGPVTVRNVVDGDTIDVQTVRGVERVRLIGVDAPETKKPRTPVQCWGVEATRTMRSLVEDRYVQLEYDNVAGHTTSTGARSHTSGSITP
ncbi:thermonuclease family protein [Gordonia sp. MP11Mi]|uniref:TNase-like domain-containing protein n=1 Tax=Gordonia sp. MP11Mi TaxID=3022769 RepID=A0AA97GTJ6_9ACTN